jgi:hypothetical protein
VESELGADFCNLYLPRGLKSASVLGDTALSAGELVNVVGGAHRHGTWDQVDESRPDKAPSATRTTLVTVYVQTVIEAAAFQLMPPLNK